MKTLLWLDDCRNPEAWVNYDGNVVWVKNFDEFVFYILTNEMPDEISFDHDLADEHIEDFLKQREDKPLELIHPSYNDFKEKTGYDAAIWLANYCYDSGVKLPVWRVHSHNLVGAENIRSYLINAQKHLNI